MSNEMKLDAPARVGPFVFRENIAWRTVIECAQRHYLNEQKPKFKPIVSIADTLKIAMGEIVLIKNDVATIKAIEQAVEDQLKASGITQDPFRLDGEKILNVIIDTAEKDQGDKCSG